MYRSKYFSIYEMTYSHKAVLNKIDNKPCQEHLENLKELMEFLDDLRESWGGAIRVTSGYRCEELNKLVGGSKTSAHLIGFAADLKPYSNQMDKFINHVIEWSKNKDFDQIIVESDSTGNKWLHIGLYNSKGQQRKQIKSLKKK
jgi:hypothetical protein